MGTISLITGGCRSGKSFFAMTKALEYKEKRLFIATAEAFDQEMKERIRKHREERADRFETVETPYNLPEALQSPQHNNAQVILVDCLTVWVGNLMYRHDSDVEVIEPVIDNFLSALCKMTTDCILVTNEVGMGVVPDTVSGRVFRDLSGSLNRKVAQCATEVVVTVCGIPLKIK